MMILTFLKKIGAVLGGTCVGGLLAFFVNFVFHLLWYMGHSEMWWHLDKWNRPTLVVGAVVGTVVGALLTFEKK